MDFFSTSQNKNLISQQSALSDGLELANNKLNRTRQNQKPKFSSSSSAQLLFLLVLFRSWLFIAKMNNNKKKYKRYEWLEEGKRGLKTLWELTVQYRVSISLVACLETTIVCVGLLVGEWESRGLLYILFLYTWIISKKIISIGQFIVWLLEAHRRVKCRLLSGPARGEAISPHDSWCLRLTLTTHHIQVGRRWFYPTQFPKPRNFGIDFKFFLLDFL